MMRVVCISGGLDHFSDPFFLILFFLTFLLKLSICKFLTLFILLIHSFYTNNINFLNTLAQKSDLGLPFIHTALTYHHKISH